MSPVLGTGHQSRHDPAWTNHTLAFTGKYSEGLTNVPSHKAKTFTSFYNKKQPFRQVNVYIYFETFVDKRFFFLPIGCFYNIGHRY